MVAELGCKPVVSSGCQLECWHGLLARQLLVFLFDLRLDPDLLIASEFDKKADYSGTCSVIKADRHEGMERAWQARRTILRCVERLRAGHVATHERVGQEVLERHEEL